MKAVIIFAVFAAISCNEADVVAQSSGTTSAAAIPASYRQGDKSLNGKWQLIPALPADTATGKTPILHFAADSKRITGNTGCNNFSGTFLLEKNSLMFNKDFISTKMACPGYDEVAFEKNLMRTNNFEINGDTLVLRVDQTPLSYWLRAN